MLRHSLFFVHGTKLRKLAVSLAAAAAIGFSFPSESILAAPAAASQEAQAPEYELDTTTLHMGTVVSAKLLGKTPEAVKHYAELVESEVKRYDDMMSVHKETPLNEVNRRAGEAVPVMPEIAEMSRMALKIADETGSAFEPMIGPLVNLWKIGFGGNEVPSDEAIK